MLIAAFWPAPWQGRAAAQDRQAGTLRIAFFNTELERKGPGLLLRDLQRGKDPQITAVIAVLATVAPDIVVLQGIDWDQGGQAAAALQARLSKAGLDLPHRFAARPNSGVASGLDIDGDGRLAEPEDAWGYGFFTGEGGLLILSRHPIDAGAVQDFTTMRWADLPGALLPWPGLAAETAADLRLSSTAHWIVPLDTPLGRVSLGTFAAAPPVFDGPEDRNGRRNHDEIAFWAQYLDGAFGPPGAGFVLAGNANLDPGAGDGRRDAIITLLGRDDLQDPQPTGHAGTATVDWPEPTPGNLRVSYVLPGTDWAITASAVHWPAPGSDGADIAGMASRHRLVWADLRPAP